MSVLLKKSVSQLGIKDIDRELSKIQEFEQDIECSNWLEVFTAPVMLDPCMHIFWEECIKSWSQKVNECPKWKETIKKYDRQQNIETLIDFYTKLCSNEKKKLLKMKKLVQEREEIQTRINSVLDGQNNKPVARPSTAKPNRQPQLASKPTMSSSAKDTTYLYEASKEEEDNAIYCKIWKRRPLSKPLQDYWSVELSPISLTGNTFQQNLLTNYCANNNVSLNQIYKHILNILPNLEATKIHPECKTKDLRAYHSACDEWLFDFSESCLYYYWCVNKNLIDPDWSSKQDWHMGGYCQSQYDENHAKAYNHFIIKG